ncbi:MAG: hypothetical protein AB1744_06565, partial [Candidatus Zixiibacteriota bacterium]
YPSLLFVDGRQPDCEPDCGIVLRNKVPAEAICFLAVDTAQGPRSSYQLYQDTLSKLTGIVISQSKCDMRGIVHGSVVTERFNYYITPTTYVNWVKDFHVDRHQLSFTPVLPVLRADTSYHDHRILRQENSVL